MNEGAKNLDTDQDAAESEDHFTKNTETVEQLNMFLYQTKRNPEMMRRVLIQKHDEVKEDYMKLYDVDSEDMFKNTCEVDEQQNKILHQPETNPMKNYHEMLDVNDEMKEEQIGLKMCIDRKRIDLYSTHYITDEYPVITNKKVDIVESKDHSLNISQVVQLRDKISCVIKEVKKNIERKKMDLHNSHYITDKSPKDPPVYNSQEYQKRNKILCTIKARLK